MASQTPETSTGPSPGLYSQSGIITILVGDNEVLFEVHQELLVTKSDFFRAALLGSFREAGDKTIRLKDDNVTEVKGFIDWLYTGKVIIDLDVFSLTRILYSFADKICAEAFCNDIMDAARAELASKNQYITASTLCEIYEAGLGESRLAIFTLKTIVFWSLSRSVTWKTLSAVKEMKEWVKQPQLLLDYSMEVIEYTTAPYENPTTWKGCHFHCHDGGSPCSASAEPKADGNTPSG